MKRYSTLLHHGNTGHVRYSMAGQPWNVQKLVKVHLQPVATIMFQASASYVDYHHHRESRSTRTEGFEQGRIGHTASRQLSWEYYIEPSESTSSRNQRLAAKLSSGQKDLIMRQLTRIFLHGLEHTKVLYCRASKVLRIVVSTARHN